MFPYELWKKIFNYREAREQSLGRCVLRLCYLENIGTFFKKAKASKKMSRRFIFIERKLCLGCFLLHTFLYDGITRCCNDDTH